VTVFFSYERVDWVLNFSIYFKLTIGYRQFSSQTQGKRNDIENFDICASKTGSLELIGSTPMSCTLSDEGMRITEHMWTKNICVHKTRNWKSLRKVRPFRLHSQLTDRESSTCLMSVCLLLRLSNERRRLMHHGACCADGRHRSHRTHSPLSHLSAHSHI